MNKYSLITLLSVFLLSGNAFSQFRPTPEGLKLERSLQMINGLYVDDVDTKELAEVAIRAMLKELDLTPPIFPRRR